MRGQEPRRTHKVRMLRTRPTQADMIGRHPREQGEGMSKNTHDRPTVSVGRDEIAELSRAWADYTSTTGNGEGPVDPILTLRKTGAILRSVNKVLASVDYEANKDEPAQAPLGDSSCLGS